MPHSQTAAQMVGSGLEANYALPTELQITNNNQILSPEARQQYEQLYHDMYLAPQQAQLSAGLYGQGRADSSAGGAALGQMMAMGAKEQVLAGEDLYNQRLNQVLQKRDSFYNHEGALASNANTLEVQRGADLAKMMQQNIDNQNNYNLSAYGQQNQFNQNNYNSAMSAMNSKRDSDFRQLSQVDAVKQQNLVQGYRGIGNTVGGLVGAAAPYIAKGVGALFGNGGSSKGPAAPYTPVKS